MSELPTMKVVHAVRGYAIINESDFDPKVHERYQEGGDPAADALRAQIESLGGKAHHKAGVEKLQAILDGLLDAPHEDAGGRSIRELNADCESLGIAIEPQDTPAAKAQKIAAAKGA